MRKVPVKYDPPDTVLWAVWKWADIRSRTDNSLVYLRRLRVVQTPWFGVYVHWIYLPDSDRFPHDHPWNFWSYIWRGWYTEDLFINPKTDIPDRPKKNIWCRWSWHSMMTTSAHQITEVSDDLVTVIFVGRRSRVWGFWTDMGWKRWKLVERAQGEMS